ncbi:MAG: M61 family metallopeptidase [Armatimonadetes bacterium]|nr:M61 family metallopeptidase [Armatimonadota bacterium]
MAILGTHHPVARPAGRRCWPGTVLLLAALIAAAPPSRCQRDPAGVHYEVSNFDAARGTCRVTVEVPGGGDLTFALARWVPGYYWPFAARHYISDVALRLQEGGAIRLREDSKRWTWHATVPQGRATTLTYTVRAGEDAGNRGLAHAFVAPDEAFFLPVSCLVYVKGQERLPHTLRVVGNRTICPLPVRDGAFQAANWDELADSPVEVGPRDLHTYTWSGRVVRLITSGPRACDFGPLAGVTRRALDEMAALFGGTPFPDYTCQLHFGEGRPRGVIGLEHARSATLIFGEQDWPTNETLRGAATNLIFHEQFHAWNAKAFRPAVLTPYRYDANPRCGTLWFVEGFTSYYGALLPVRAGVWTREQFYADAAHAYDRTLRSAGRGRTSLRRASEAAFASPVYGEGEGTSYYNQGQLVAMLLDLRLRTLSDGRRSLDDVMRWVFRQYPSDKRGYADDFLPGAIRQATGLDLSAECTRFIDGVADLPVEQYLALAGLRVEQIEGRPRITEDPMASPQAVALREGWLSERDARRAERRVEGVSGLGRWAFGLGSQ